MSDLATIRIPIDSSDMVQAVRDSKNLERGIKMLVTAFDSGAIGADQFNTGLSQIRKEFQYLFTNYQQATSRVRGFASALLESVDAADAAANSKRELAEATKRAETAFALANQKAKEELETLRNRAEFAWAMAMQREREAESAVAAANKQAQAEAKLTQEILKRRNATEQAAAQKAQAFQAQIGPNLGLGAQGVSASASASAFEAEIERLRQKYDSVYVASQLYESSLKELDQAHGLGVLSANRYKAAVDQLNLEYQQFANTAEGAVIANNRFSQHVNQTAGTANQFGVVMQQAGYQVGDFLVQIQSGTNWMVALGQQATQLVGVLPLMGAGFMGLSSGALVALSAGLGIAIPLITALGAVWMRTTEDVKSGGSEIENVLKTLQQETDTLSQKWSELKFGNIAGQSLEDLKNQASGLRAEIEALTTQAAESVLRPFINLQGYSIEQKKQELQLVVDQLNALEETLRVNAEKASQIEKANAINEQMLAVELAHARAIGDAKRQQDAMTEAAQNALSKYSMMRTVAAGIANEMARAAANTQAAADAALTAMRIEFSPAGGAMSRFGGRGTVSDRSITNQYGDVITLPGSNRPQRRPTDIDFGVSNISGGGGGSKQEDALQKLREQLALENELLGVSEAQKRVIQALGDQRSKYSATEIQAITAEIEAYDRKLQALEQQQQLAQTMQSSMETAFMSIVSGTESAKDAFKKMAYEMIKELYRVLVVQRMVGQFQSGGGGILGGLFGFLGRGPSTGALGLPKFASGGSMMPGKPYLVGEQGPEIVVPRHSGTVVNAQQSANAMGNGGSITVQNNISVTGSDAAMVRAEVAKMIPQITNATKAAVIDARLRGGQMAAAFR